MEALIVYQTEELNMSIPDGYQIDFEADQLPVWFIPEEGTIAYHLYPRCGHINQRGDYELSRRTLPFKKGQYNSLDDFTDQIRSGRHMCGHCWKRFQKEWFQYSLENNEPPL